MMPDRRFIWTDKVTLAVAALLFVLVGALWLFVFATVGSAGAMHIFHKSGSSGLALAAVAVGSFWVVLQGIDYAARGAWRLVTRTSRRARLTEGSLIDGQPFRGTVSAALPFQATPALAPLMAHSPVRNRSNVYDLRSRLPESLEAL